MKKSITIAALLAVGSSAAGAAAGVLPNPYYGSDTLYKVTQDAITAVNTNISATSWVAINIGPGSQYVGGGSGGAAAAMSANGAASSAALQQTGPMSRMIKKEASVCSFNGDTTGKGVNDTNASGIVIGLDAVAIVSSLQSGGQSTCGKEVASGSTNAGGGAVTTQSFKGGGTDPQTWKWALALVYGGLDISTCTGHATSCAPQDCSSPARANLVSNWSNMFQGGCSPSATVQASGVSASSLCGAGSPANGALWHAFRRDDTSGTADVFATLLGLSPGVSNSANNGFGASPYCNAMNWDTNAAQAGNCQEGTHDQFSGPGGVTDPLSTYDTGGTNVGAGVAPSAGQLKHRMPPSGVNAIDGNTYGVWGTNPITSVNQAWDVLPTQMQDNDPIRRQCQGTSVGNSSHSGEEVCNIDGTLGLVLPMTDDDWIIGATFNGGPPLAQYPTAQCLGAFQLARGIHVINCAPRGTSFHDGQCPNGDSEIGSGCVIPTSTGNGTSTSTACLAAPSTTTIKHTRTLAPSYGRAYNLQMIDGTLPSGGKIGYAQYPIPANVSGGVVPTVDYVGAYNRLHTVETIVGPGAIGCQEVDMTDQIGCMAQADPCSIGFAGYSSATWQTRNPLGTTGTDTAGTWDIAALQIAGVAPGTSTVQALGTSTEYQASRKLYFNTLLGFGNVNAEGAGGTTGDPNAADEIVLAKFESIAGNIQPIAINRGYFGIGSQSPQGVDGSGNGNPFCEDFNEHTICASVAANNNGCVNNNGVTVTGEPGSLPGENGANPNTAPAQSTICGDGALEAFEECDGTLNAGTGGCSSTCRCLLDFNPTAARAGGGVGACN